MSDSEKAALAGKRLVKTGLGVFAPDGDVTALGLTEVVVSEGVYEANALTRLGKNGSAINVNVTDGATFRLGFGMGGTAADKVLHVTAGGSGASGEGGAVVFTASSGMGNKFVNWTLTSDTVFYVKGSLAQVDFSDNGYGPTGNYNNFYMNGHSLRIKGDSTAGTTASGAWVRFRSGPTFITPGELIFDKIRFTRYNTGGARAWTDATTKAKGRIPCIRLVNGTRCNFADNGDSAFLSYVGCVDCEAGTEIGDMGVSTSDVPGTYTINKLVGAPAILSVPLTATKTPHQPKIKEYVARASDVLDGKLLTSTTNLTFLAGASAWIDDPDGALVPETDYQVATSALPIVGRPHGGLDRTRVTRCFDVTQEEKALSVSYREATVAADEFPVNVPSGATNTWTEVKNLFGTEGLAGKKLLKIGGGTLNAAAEDVASSGAAELVVAQGVYAFSNRKALPVADNVMKVTVRDGATLSVGANLTSLHNSNTVQLWLTTAGEGVLGPSGRRGAVEFTVAGGGEDQFVRYTLAGDSLFTFPCGGVFMFSGAGGSLESRTDHNVFEMGGHALTFRRNGVTTAAGIGWVRFRLGIRCREPGPLVLDGVGLTRYNGGSIAFLDGSTAIPEVRLVNFARINLSGNGFAGSLASLDFAEGTGIARCPSWDDPSGDVTVQRMTGLPTIEESGTQRIFVREYVAHAADVLANKPMTVANLRFASPSCVGVDGIENLTEGTEYLVARATEALSGSPTGGNSRESSNCVYTAHVDGDRVYASFRQLDPLAADEVGVFVPALGTKTWAQAVADLPADALKGKKLVKLGSGTLAPGADVTTAGATELIVRAGTYQAAAKIQLPIADGVMKVTVEDGAALAIAASLSAMTDASHALSVIACGAGPGGGGAVWFAANSGAANQWANWELSGDSVFGVADAVTELGFSCDSLSYSSAWNNWRMHGHSLTFRKLKSSVAGVVRFRSGPTIREPGELTFDGISFSRYNWCATAILDANGRDTSIPCMCLRNGAFANFASSTSTRLDTRIGRLDCAFGTGLKYVGLTTDTPGPVTIARLTGWPSVSTDQTLEVTTEYLVDASELAATPAPFLDGQTNLTFSSTCAMVVDNPESIDLTEPVVIARAPKGMLSGRPRCPKGSAYALRRRSDEVYDYLELKEPGGLILVVR